MSINFNWIISDNETFAETLRNELDAIGIEFPSNYKDIRPSVQIAEWGPKVEEIVGVMNTIIPINPI